MNPARSAISSPVIHTKLPKVGTPIFTVMSALAIAHKAVNLGQGCPDFDWSRVEAAVTPRARAILVNMPHNPSGRILRDADRRALEAITLAHDLFVIADEVCEHMVFDGPAHVSAIRYPALADALLFRQARRDPARCLVPSFQPLRRA